MSKISFYTGPDKIFDCIFIYGQLFLEMLFYDVIHFLTENNIFLMLNAKNDSPVYLNISIIYRLTLMTKNSAKHI